MNLKDRLTAEIGSMVPDQGVKPEIFWKIYHKTSPAMRQIIIDAMVAARAEGRVQPCPNNGDHNFWGMRAWDKFCDGGLDAIKEHHLTKICHVITRHLVDVIDEWATDSDGAGREKFPDISITTISILEETEKIETVTAEHVPKIVDLLMAELHAPQSRNIRIVGGDMKSQFDGRRLECRWNGWQPVLYEFLPDYSGSRPADLPPEQVAALRYGMRTEGRLAILKRHDTEFFTDAYRTAIDKIKSDYDSSDLGSNRQVLREYAATGLIELPLGDHFPNLLTRDGVIRACWMPESEEMEGYDILGDDSLDRPVIGCLERVLDMCETLGAGRELAREAVERDGIVMDIPPGEIFLYAPFGSRVEMFGEKFLPKGHTTHESHGDIFWISPDALEYEGICAIVEMPEIIQPDGSVEPS